MLRLATTVLFVLFLFPLIVFAETPSAVDPALPAAGDTVFPGSLAAGADTVAAPKTRFLHRIVEARRLIEKEIDGAAAKPLEKARLLVMIGRLEEADRVLDAAGPATEAERRDLLLLRAEALLRRYAFAEAESLLARAERIDPASEEAFRLRLTLLERREDLGRIDAMTTARLARLPGSVAALLGRALLEYQLLRTDEAEKSFEEAFALASRPENGVSALTGLARIAEKRGNYENAAALAAQALDAGAPDPELLNAIASILFRLGENGEGIDVAHEVLEWDSWNEQAHYYLGNGFSKRTYSELERAFPDVFPDTAARPLLEQMRDLVASGRRGEARTHIRAFRSTRPSLVEPDLLLGALFWEEGKYDSAIARFRGALRTCPEHGRAHNGFAKAMEGKRLRASVNRDRIEREFAEAPFPEIPRIEEFVTNHRSLSERHRKRVALSVEPWARFVPVFVEAGASVYIKPLYERLSETPHQQVLRDLRISYDSRLWDDVRGCGGFHTVTGIEDVERSIHRKYNTLLHELTHQVHYVLTPDEKRLIQETYRAAKEKEHAGEKRFLSRYQGSSVWEYFAEGMNSYQSPRSGPYDVREVVRERLAEIDPDLEFLIEKVVADTAVARYYAPALVAAAYDRIENGRPGEAFDLLEKALARSPEDEGGLCALSYTHLLLGDPGKAVRAAGNAIKEHENAPGPWLENARAVFHESGSYSDQIAILIRAREKVESSQRYLIELALGRAYLGRGDLEKAKESFGWVLRYQEDNPEALWGIAAAEGLASDTAEANAFFVRAIRGRSGVAELRADYARFLVRHGRFEEAEKQIREARLIEPRSADAEAAAGLLAIYLEDWLEARRRLADALAFAPHSDLATILLAHTWIATGDADHAEEILRPVLDAVEKEAPPEIIYLERKGEYRAIHTYPAEERWLLHRTASELAAARGDPEGEERSRRLMGQTFR
ncbi:MAG: tetratricopeptide repeat protein [Candidatus Eisenbacteria bacterium]